MPSQRFLLVTSGLLGVVAVGGWTCALVKGREAAAQIDALQARIDHGTVFDDTTGLLNRAGANLLALRIVNIARRDSDAVCGALIRILPPNGRAGLNDEDVLAVAEASQVVFRSGDAVGRVAGDTILVVGKGPGFRVATVESRLVAQMVSMAPPDTPLPGILVSVAVLHPWDEGSLPELEQRLANDLEVRLAVHGMVGHGEFTG
ncbi:MAG: hypothetical protein QG597_207 [Actinomycetota bacterium]|nr:hypothetical protein [Actinomycetota bacterium]